MVWGLFALSMGAAWALALAADVSLWTPIVATALVALAASGLWPFRRRRAARAAVDVFANTLFADAGVATRSDAEIRRLRIGIPAAGSSTHTPLARYVLQLDILRGRIAKELEARGPSLDPRWLAEALDETRREALELIGALDDESRTILSPLIEAPLTLAPARGRR